MISVRMYFQTGMIKVRSPDSIYQARGDIEHGAFYGRWHFSFGGYYDPEYMQFGPLRVFNDDTLSPGAVWPLHYHEEIEVVTYCAEGVFRHADQHGEGGLLRKGWVQHTTVGSGMYHSEINASQTEPMRFIQMWFLPAKPGLKPSTEQKTVGPEERADRLLPLISNSVRGALRICQDVAVFSSHLSNGRSVTHMGRSGRGAYLYVLQGGPVVLNGRTRVPALGAAMIPAEPELTIQAQGDSAEILLVDVPL
ncbi:MAG TPA: pirin family protein [Methanocella sp.]|nr:pirin family protein [Methanocella sp.]